MKVPDFPPAGDGPADALPQRLLDHMNESGVYAEADLLPFQTRLKELKGIIVTDRDKEVAAKKEAEVDGVADEHIHPEGLTKLLLRKWEHCSESVSTVSCIGSRG